MNTKQVTARSINFDRKLIPQIEAAVAWAFMPYRAAFDGQLWLN